MSLHTVTPSYHTNTPIGNDMLHYLILSHGDKYTFNDVEMTLTWYKNEKVMRIRSFETVQGFLDFLSCL